MNLRPNTSISKIRRSVGKSERERRRTSSKRRRRLEKLARWVSGKKVKVFFQDRGAKCQEASSGAKHDLEVYVPTAEHEQTETELEPSVWDFVFQKAELIHELMHVIYTDFETFEEYIDEIGDMHKKRVFKRIFNIAEDGAIERQGAADYNIGRDLRIKNENLMRAGEPGQEEVGGERVLNFQEAFELFLMDKVKFDTERARQLLDPTDDEYQFIDEETRERLIGLLPRTWEFRSDVLTEPDGAERIRIAYEYFRDIEDELEDAGAMTDQNMLMQLMRFFPNDGDVYVVMPGEPPEDAEALEPDDDDIIIQLAPPEGAPPGEGPESEGGEGDVEQEYGVQVEADGEGEDEGEIAAEWQKSVNATGENLRTIDHGEVESDHWAKAKQRARRYEQQLRRRLQQERASEIKPDQRAGRPDVQALWKLGYGETRVFEEEREPDEKTYSVVILLDRSGSMGGDAGSPWIVDEAEITAAALAMALEELGADVAVLSVSGNVYLEKSFEHTVEDRRDVLLRDHSSNGTPLGSALELAKDQLDRRGGQSLVFSITDGQPTDGYDDVLESVTFPVVGAYFRQKKPDVGDVREYYHRVMSSDKDGLAKTVEALIERMVV